MSKRRIANLNQQASAVKRVNLENDKIDSENGDISCSFTGENSPIVSSQLDNTSDLSQNSSGSEISESMFSASECSMHSKQGIHFNTKKARGNIESRCVSYSSLHDNSDCDSVDMSDVSSEFPISKSAKKGSKRICGKDEILKLQCEWKGCDYLTNDVDIFGSHVACHITELEVTSKENTEESYLCLWEDCYFDSADPREIVRHVNYHSYHTKLKALGANTVTRMKFPDCKLDPANRNFLPELFDDLLCLWEDCGKIFTNMQSYLNHVRGHVLCNPRGRYVKGGVKCLWKGCLHPFKTVYKLGDHVRTHTGEKLIACPTCGSMFASRTKFFDHCKCQVPSELQSYQCRECFNKYSSERLLRDHMRRHINQYKCAFCIMTFPNPSAVAAHIRYRHIDSRPFKCHYCDYSTVTHQDLKRHIHLHYDGAFFSCEEKNCEFSCRSIYTLKSHYQKVHDFLYDHQFVCHLCDNRFDRGNLLTRHLQKQHGLLRNNEISRLRYKRDENGLYNVMAIRYDTLEVTQELLSAESATISELSQKQYCVREISAPSSLHPQRFEAIEVDSCEEKSSGNSILITIEEIDSKGNVTVSEVVETQEVRVANTLPENDSV